MPVCPVCDHAQAAGSECEVCGRRLVFGVTAADLAIPPVEGLEPTGFSPVDVVEEAMGELEPTAGKGAGEVAVDETPDLEETRVPPVDVDAPPLPDIERSGVPVPEDGPTLAPAVLTCRYCRTPASHGEKICARCGMRLPFFSEAPPQDAPAAERLCTCGFPLRESATRCPSCGARIT
jgi:hypothetical protein